MGFSGGRKPGEGISSPTKCGVYIRLLSEAWPQEESGTKKETGEKGKSEGRKKDYWALRECSSNSGTIDQCNPI